MMNCLYSSAATAKPLNATWARSMCRPVVVGVSCIPLNGRRPSTIISAPEQVLFVSFSAAVPPPVLRTLHVSQSPFWQRNAKCPAAPSLLHPIPW